MSQIEINPRWGIQIEGEEYDVSVLENYLKDNFSERDDYFIWHMYGVAPLKALSVAPVSSEDEAVEERREEPEEFTGSVPILRTLKWDKYNSASDVAIVMKETVRTLSGCLRILNYSAPLKGGTVYEFTSPTTYRMTRDTQIEFYVRSRPEDNATAREFARVLKLVDKYQWLAGCLPLLEASPDCFTCYKAIESIEMHLGGENQMIKSKIFDGVKLKKAKRMANSYRHFDNKRHQPPDPPVTLDEARKIVFDSLRAIITTL